MHLVIVESPTKARTLSKFLGGDYQIEASMGHIRDLPKSTLGVNVEQGFAPEYVVVAGREKKIKELQAAAKKAKQVILATDPDREGEAIAFHVREVLRASHKQQATSNKFKRIVFHEITKSAIEDALGHPGKINMNLVDAQQGRRVLDRLVGYKLSPLLWKKIRRGLSAGRVQSVAVRLIVEREREIEAFKPQEFWLITATLSHKPTVKATDTFVVTLSEVGGKKVRVREEETKADPKTTIYLDSKAVVEPILTDLERATYRVAEVVKKEVHTSPPPSFMTSTLQRVAANAMGWSSKKTMQVAQRLYERGLITYHRTDSLNIAKEALASVASYITSEYGQQYGLPSPRYFRSSSKSAQEAHEAIRPTDVGKFEIRSPKSETGDREGRDFNKLYQLIWRRFVASQMAQATFDRTTIKVNGECKIESGKLRTYGLRATGRVMRFAGWTKVYETNPKSEILNSKQIQNSKFKIQNDEEQQLPEVVEGETLTKKKVNGEQKFTEPAARFNEASLIKALEERGIGRPSTYAPIISTIQARQYVEKTEQRFYPTAIGIAVTDFLCKYFPEVMDYDFTAGLENDLDAIAAGKKSWEKVIGAFYGPFSKDLVRVEEKAERVKVAAEQTGDTCPECKQGEVVIRLGKFGKFLSCSRFPECKYTAQYKETLAGIQCPKDGGDIVVRRTKTGRRFYGCVNYPKCDWASWRKPK